MKTKHFAKHNRMACAIILCAAAVTGVHAQGYMSDAASSSAVNTRDPARQASTEIDAVVNNPAGTAFLEDGLHLSASGMFLFSAENFSSFHYGGAVIQSANDKNFFPLPAIQIAYKHKKWGISASYNFDLAYDYNTSTRLHARKTLPQYIKLNNKFSAINESLLQLIEEQGLQNMGISKYDNLIFGNDLSNLHVSNHHIRIGAFYQISKNLSVYGGIKSVIINDENLYETNFSNLEEYVPKWSQTIEALIANNDYSTNKEVSSITKDIIDFQAETAKNSKVEKYYIKGLGLSPVIGVDYRYKNLNFGAKYEFATHINADGIKDFNIPASLSVGMSWQATQKWKVAAGSNVSFIKADELPDDYDVSNAFDISASITYNFNKKWLISGGYTYSQGIQTSPESLSINTDAGHYNKISLGTAFSPIERLQFNFGVSSYLNKTETISRLIDYPDTKISTEYKPDMQLALGINYRI